METRSETRILRSKKDLNALPQSGGIPNPVSPYSVVRIIAGRDDKSSDPALGCGPGIPPVTFASHRRRIAFPCSEPNATGPRCPSILTNLPPMHTSYR